MSKSSFNLSPKEIVDKDTTTTYLVYANEWDAEFALARLTPYGATTKLVCHNGYFNAIECKLLQQ